MTVLANRSLTAWWNKIGRGSHYFSDKYSFDAHTDTTIKTKYVIGLCAGAPRIQHPTPTVSLSSVFPVSFDV